MSKQGACPGTMPNLPASLNERKRSAEVLKIFDGIHPRLRHVPPGFSFSMIVTSAPSAAALTAVTYPPGPAPMTTIFLTFPFS